MATGDSMIRVTDLKKYYKGGAIKALDGVTVDINKGDVIAVIGPSGSGNLKNLQAVPSSSRERILRAKSIRMHRERQ